MLALDSDSISDERFLDDSHTRVPFMQHPAP